MREKIFIRKSDIRKIILHSERRTNWFFVDSENKIEEIKEILPKKWYELKNRYKISTVNKITPSRFINNTEVFCKTRTELIAQGYVIRDNEVYTKPNVFVLTDYESEEIEFDTYEEAENFYTSLMLKMGDSNDWINIKTGEENGKR